VSGNTPSRRSSLRQSRFDVVDTDAFAAFKTELAARKDRPKPETPATPREKAPRRIRLRWLLIPIILAPVVTGIVTLVQRFQAQSAMIAAEIAATAPAPVEAAPPSPSTESTVNINSHPQGATVLIDGKPRGVTPLKIVLPVGRHQVQLRNGFASRSLPLDIEPNTATTQYIELQAGPSVPDGFGQLDVQSTPAGARVVVDGEFRGQTPLTIARLGAGSHQVVLTSKESSFSRVVTIAPGATSSVVASLAPAATVSVGWMVIESPLELQVFSGSRRIGTGLDRIMLPAGTHTIDFVNEQYKYRSTSTVDVTAGQTTTTRVEVPVGRLSINALPWAEVLIDGRPVGTTPLAYIAVPIGTHEIVWRHPQHGERRQVVSIGADQPVRVGMDFNR
jgi:hypothetical protein